MPFSFFNVTISCALHVISFLVVFDLCQRDLSNTRDSERNVLGQDGVKNNKSSNVLKPSTNKRSRESSLKPNNETTECDQSSLSTRGGTKKRSSSSGISTRSSSRLIAKRQHEERDDRSTKKQKFVEESSSIKKVESQKTRRRSARLNNKNQSRTEEFEGGAKICPENQDKKPSKSDIENSKKTNISKTEYLVHPEHRLKRDTFDGINHTQGIAPHDENVDDVLKVAPYATDLYQHWYHVEVSFSFHLIGRCETKPLSKNSCVLNRCFQRGGAVHECTWIINLI